MKLTIPSSAPDYPTILHALESVASRTPARRALICEDRSLTFAEHARAIMEVSARPEFAPHLQEMGNIWNFAGAEETEARLRRAGFEEVRCWLEPKPVIPPDPLAFTMTVTLGPQLAQLPEQLRQPYAEAVIACSEQPLTLDYVRLNMEARVPASAAAPPPAAA